MDAPPDGKAFEIIALAKGFLVVVTEPYTAQGQPKIVREAALDVQQVVSILKAHGLNLLGDFH